ncbi:MAG TPA: MoxR family ATPase [Longimicrobiales bacterium]|nr:MoxR family ATPase [Longimicrobiales bacterium]
MATVIEGAALQESDDIELAERMKDGADRIQAELRKLIIGQDQVVEHMLMSLFVGGNSLLIGVPGLAKTLLVHSLAQVLSLKFSRIQFTPDLMPSDITGTDIIQEDSETGRRQMVFSPGPIFSNIVLADEINRTPPKTQAALLEAMQEHRVTVQGRTYTLEEPFHVFATQNPIELEGTYPLPEAQLDRFMFQIVIDHLPEEEEMTVVRSTTAVQEHVFEHAVSGADLVAYQRLVRRVPVSDPVLRYAVNLVRATRPGEASSASLMPGAAPDFIRSWVSHGASVRAAQYLILGGKARALMHGRTHVSFEDVRALAAPVLRHRILLNFHAESERVTTDHIIGRLVEAVPVPRSGM